MRERIELNRRLAELYPSFDAARRILSFTAIQVIEIDISGAPLLFWNNIIEYALRSEVDYISLLNCVLSDYSNDQIVKNAIESFVPSVVVTDTQFSESIEPFESILKIIDENKFGPLRRVDCNRSEQYSSFVQFAKEKNCVISYLVGPNENSPQSFYERIVLDRIVNYPNKRVKSYSVEKNGSQRYDVIPFDIHPELEVSINTFKRSIENLGEEFSFEKDCLKVKNISNRSDLCSYAINYNYSEGKHILSQFTAWLYNACQNTGMNFHFFFVFYDIESNIISKKNDIENIANNLNIKGLLNVGLFEPANENDIKAWQAKIGAEDYGSDDLLTDLAMCGIDKLLLSTFEQTKVIPFKYFEKFQNELYNAFVKK